MLLLSIPLLLLLLLLVLVVASMTAAASCSEIGCCISCGGGESEDCSKGNIARIAHDITVFPTKYVY